MPPKSILILALLGVSDLSLEHDKVIQEESLHCSWACMTFALEWPGAFCVGLKNRAACEIPLDIQNWTIHGLWPASVERCCECWPIFHSDLQELEPEISHLWPSLITGDNFRFWRNEWFKHGTCAACREGMNSPTRYFQTALKLRGQFPIDEVLSNAGIKPSCNYSYETTELHDILHPILGDRHEIQCVKDHLEREVLVQVKILLNLNFTLGCQKPNQNRLWVPSPEQSSSPGHPCPLDSTIFYFPINYEDPYEPCG